MSGFFKLTMLLSLCMATFAFGQIPQTMSYQGVLTEANGNPVNGSVSLTFKLYDAATGGTKLWEETQQVTVINGLFNVILGSVNPLTLPFDKPYWLGICVDGGAELTPRIELTSSPYSMTAQSAQTISGQGEVVRRIITPTASHTDTVHIRGAGATTVASIGDTILISSTDTAGGGGDNDWIDTGASVHTTNKSIQLFDPSGAFPFSVNNGVNPAVRVTATSDNDGIQGISTGAGNGIIGKSTDGAGVFGQSTNHDGVLGKSVNRDGVRGESAMFAGVFGTTMGSGFQSAGVQGMAVDAPGVRGESEKSTGVIGETSATDDAGVFGDGGDSSIGVEGISVERDGVNGMSDLKNGVFGSTQGNASMSVAIAGVHGDGGTGAPGVCGFSQAEGVYGLSNGDAGVRGRSITGMAGKFEGEVHILNGPKPAKLLIAQMETDNTAPCLVWSGDTYVRMRECWTIEDDNGTAYLVSAQGIRVKGGEGGQEVVYEVKPDGTSFHKGKETFAGGLEIPNANGSIAVEIKPDTDPNTEYAITVNGNLQVNGIMMAQTKLFRIDHPLDPQNQYLHHTSVESPDMKNVYDGVISLNETGEVWVELPEWFEALNKDFRYQLTCIGGFANVYIKEEIQNNRFKISGGRPDLKISWQVTGIRDDAFARANRNHVESMK